MTYDDHPEICELASGYSFELRRVKMKTTHHSQKDELLIGRDLSWYDDTYNFRVDSSAQDAE